MSRQCGRSRALKPAAMRPQPQSRIGDKENLFAINLVVAVVQLFRIVALRHRLQVAVLKAHALDLFPAQIAGAPRDFEAAFRRRMNQVRGRAQIRGQVAFSFTAFSVAGVPR